MKRMTGFLAAVFAGAAAFGGVTHWAVDPMSETPYLPDVIPEDGRKGGTVQIIAAKGEYEPGSFVVRADEDLGRVSLEVSELKSADGKRFPQSKLDLKVVKVWYQSGNAWFSYFADKGAKLCPELLLNDEDLIRVDVAKKSNYARLVEKDGRVHEHWLCEPKAFKDRARDLRGTGHFRIGDTFVCMKENFRDAKKLMPVALPKDVSKQFFLTANVTKDTLAGLYKGTVTISRETPDKKRVKVAAVPVALRVLPFELPRPMCYFDPYKPFVTWFCDYINLSMIRDQNGNDEALARKQLANICRDFAQHGQYVPSFGGADGEPEIVRAGGQDYCDLIPVRHGTMRPAALRDMRVNARRLRRFADRSYGKDSHPVQGYGDEYGFYEMRQFRPMIKLYQQYGFRFPMNCQMGYMGGIDVADIFWPPVTPDHDSADMTARYNDATGGKGTFGWYACQHVGVENPAFTRRQYGFGPYRAGLSCNFNYAHHIDEWNDSAAELYRPMAMNYGCYDGVIDTIQWEGFREGQDDIRYATVLKRLALPFADAYDNVEARAEARLALHLLAEAEDDSTDLTTLRREMIRHILKLMKFKAAAEKSAAEKPAEKEVQA